MTEQVNLISKIPAPYNKDVEFFDVTYENQFQMLRLRIREGKRFTTIDLDPVTAKEWLSVMEKWAQQAKMG